MAETSEGGGAQDSGGYDYKRLHSYPLIRVSFFVSQKMSCTFSELVSVSLCLNLFWQSFFTH